MASLDSLSDGQRAVLQLLLRQNKSYDDLASLLKTDARRRARPRPRCGHRARARAGRASTPTAATRSPTTCSASSRRRAARRRASTSRAPPPAAAGPAGRHRPGPARRRRPARDPGRARGGLRGLRRAGPPRRAPGRGQEELAAGRPPDRRRHRRRAGDRDHPRAEPRRRRRPGVLGHDARDDSTQATTPTGDVFEVKAQGTLRPPEGSQSEARGEVAIVHFPDNDQFRLAFQATGLPPSSTRGSAYGVWIYSSPTQNRFLGFPDTVVGADGKLETVSDLAPDTPAYSQVLLTRETAESPKRPGTIILRGRLVTAAAADGWDRYDADTGATRLRRRRRRRRFAG